MNKLIIALTLTASLNAMALECYDNATCSKKATSLVKKALNKKICKPEARAAFASIRNGKFDSNETNALDACIKAQKSFADIQALENALR